MPLITITLYFFIYSLLGWICESLYKSIARKKIINSGLLNGPLCPIYGFGAILIILLLTQINTNPFLIFAYGMLITSLLEYITSYLLEKIFHMSWWDYSHHKYNIHGRVCLLNSTLFGIMSLFTIYILHPTIQSISLKIDYNIQVLLVCLLLFLLTIDLLVSITSILNMNKTLNKIHNHIQSLYENSVVYDFIEENHKVIQKFNKKHQHIIRAFPNLNHKVYDLKEINIDEIIKKFSKK